MAGDTSAPAQGERLPNLTQEELGRLLIEQFYQDSVAHYGVDSEQARERMYWCQVLPLHIQQRRLERPGTGCRGAFVG